MKNRKAIIIGILIVGIILVGSWLIWSNQTVIITKEQAIDIASQTEEFKEFLKLYPDAKINAAQHCCAEIKVYGGECGCISKPDDNWIVAYCINKGCWESRYIPSARVAINSRTSQIIAKYPKIEYIKNEEYCEEKGDCLCASCCGGCTNFIYEPLIKARTENILCFVCACTTNDCKCINNLCQPAQKITDLCEKDREFAESVSSSPECIGQDFICVDGWTSTAYYDSRLTDVVQTEEEKDTTIETPEELADAIVARYAMSSCSCKKPVSYHALTEGELEETDCENFYMFIDDYNSSCNGCILTWETNCC